MVEVCACYAILYQVLPPPPHNKIFIMGNFTPSVFSLFWILIFTASIAV